MNFKYFQIVFMLILETVSFVVGDFYVGDPSKNFKVLYKTSSDLIRTSTLVCTGLYKKSFTKFQLVTSVPINACIIPNKPPFIERNVFSQWYNYFFKDLDVDVEPKWILLVSDVPGEISCDMETKVRNAKIAGYDAVILGTLSSTKFVTANKLLDAGLLLNKFDVHLVNPFDVEALSRKYAYPNEFPVIFFDISTWCFKKRHVKEKNATHENTSYNLQIVASLGILGFLYFVITYTLVLNWEFQPFFQSEPPPSPTPPPRSSRRRPRSSRRPPPRPSPPRSTLPDEIIYHLRILELSEMDLTVENIKAKYRELALRNHPDKNKNIDTKELMQKLNKARAELLVYVENNQ